MGFAMSTSYHGTNSSLVTLNQDFKRCRAITTWKNRDKAQCRYTYCFLFLSFYISLPKRFFFRTPPNAQQRELLFVTFVTLLLFCYAKCYNNVTFFEKLLICYRKSNFIVTITIYLKVTNL